jgi:hypothetical protein
LADPIAPPPIQMSRAESDALAKRRRGRNVAMLLVLLAVALLFYAIAMVKMATPGFAP